MTVYSNSFTVFSNKLKPMFHDVTEKVRQAVSTSKVNQGIVSVYSQHTTCSIILQEESHDIVYDGTKFLFQDLLEVLEKLIPTCGRERQYLHPGNQHIAHAVENLGEEAVWSLNTDAHLRSCIIGRSETIPVIDGQLQLGEFGLVYFADFDAVRQRERTIHVQVLGE